MSGDFIAVTPTVQTLTIASPAQGPAGPAGGSGTGTTVGTVGGLSSLTDSTMANGAQAFVSSVKGWFVLDKTSTATSVALSVVVTLSGTGRWVRQPWIHGSQLLQTDRAVDPQNVTGVASDEAAGTAAAPLLTWAELYRRLPSVNGLTSNVTVLALSNAGATEQWTLDGTIGAGSVNVVGTRQVVRTGTLSARVNRVRGTSTPYQITDSIGASWSAYTDGTYFVRITSGANAGIRSKILKDLGGGAVRVGEWLQPTATTIFAPTVNFSITGNETYELYRPCAMPLVTVRLDQATYANVLYQAASRFEDCYFPTPVAFAESSISGSGNTFFLNCAVTFMNVTESDTASFIGCSVASTGQLAFIGVGQAFFYAGSLAASAEVYLQGGVLYVNFDTIGQGRSLFVAQSGLLLLGDVASFDNDTAIGFVSTYAGGMARFYGNHTFWGSGNTGAMIAVTPGSQGQYQPASGYTFVVTGSGGGYSAISLGGKTTVNALRSDTLAPTGAIALTFASLVASYAGGGFNGSVTDQETQASFVKTT